MQVQSIDKMCANAISIKGLKKIIIWGSNHFALSLQKELNENYSLDVYCLVDDDIEIADLNVKQTAILMNKSAEYLVLITKIVCKKILQLIESYGYSFDDYIYMDLNMNDHFTGKIGLEIGGPSQFFYGIYDKLKICDGVNFSFNTVWGETGALKGYFYQGKKLGDFFLTDAVELNAVKDDNYDFLLSSNNLEHIANPIKAILRWKDVIKKGGEVLVIVPNKEFSFDHLRDYTCFSHILQDYQDEIDEKDLSHLNEIMEKHDLDIDVRAGGYENFRKRSLDNYNNRCLHHHVFNMELLVKIFEYCHIQVEECGRFRECYYILGRI